MMYTIRQASTLLGIPAVTIRAWETRYEAIKPIRQKQAIASLMIKIWRIYASSKTRRMRKV